MLKKLVDSNFNIRLNAPNESATPLDLIPTSRVTLTILELKKELLGPRIPLTIETLKRLFLEFNKHQEGPSTFFKNIKKILNIRDLVGEMLPKTCILNL